MPGSTQPTKSWLADTVTLIARIVIGIILIVHGWEKIDMGVDATATQVMAPMDVPYPTVAAVVAMVIEFGGGITLLLGAVLPVTGVLLAVHMALASYFGHFAMGAPLTGEGGAELPLSLGAGALALGFTGGGFALDRFTPWGRRRRAARRDAGGAGSVPE
ncbi:putative oxidoreductase [Haloactinospora alba]|uniref:Putative oxidoreductase n=1 Tax=Haloactinospora alba TaxID=405555 RepID=A0A543NHT8_9ACTN|nr:DoxX family protein [Haloactinospora alba]TQN31379.1 putative oxidoreductase [Haloactinospora alba]